MRFDWLLPTQGGIPAPRTESRRWQPETSRHPRLPFDLSDYLAERLTCFAVVLHFGLELTSNSDFPITTAA